MIDFVNLESTPDIARDLTHHYCDYVELLALVDSDNGVSRSDVYDRFLEDSRISGVGSEEGGKSYDQWTSEIDDWFTELSSRALAYSDTYPFEFHAGLFTLKDNLTDRQYLYLGLLLCSLLRYVQSRSSLSSAFECLCLYATKSYLPHIAEVHLFGVSSGNSSRYEGNLETRIRLLAEDMNFPVSNRPNLFRNRDNGDGGVDVVAWLPFNNDSNLDKKLVLIGQSASTLEWATKQHSVERLRSFLNIENNFLNTLYVPYDMRDASRNLSNWSLITVDILFDRHRILQLVQPDEFFSSSLGRSMYELIDAAVFFEEDIV